MAKHNRQSFRFVGTTRGSQIQSAANALSTRHSVSGPASTSSDPRLAVSLLTASFASGSFPQHERIVQDQREVPAWSERPLLVPQATQ